MLSTYTPLSYLYVHYYLCESLSTSIPFVSIDILTDIGGGRGCYGIQLGISNEIFHGENIRLDSMDSLLLIGSCYFF